MAGKRPKGRPEALGALLRSSFEGTSLGERLRDLAIWQQWEQVVGPAIARRTRPLRLSGGVLTVMVGSAPWMQQLSFMKADLIARLNSCLGEERIRDIVLKSGRVLEADQGADTEPESLARPLSQQERDWIDQQAAALDDPDLKEQFKALMEQHYRFLSVE